MQSTSTLSKNHYLRTIALIIALAFFNFTVHSQNTTENIIIESQFQDYSKIPREIAFAHLNKSVYIKGETVAFKVYVFDKYDKGLSKLTKNLYWNISDSEGKVIKKEMLLVENGVANGSFFTDSLFTSGNYIFKAYTNWMRNFNEQNHYVQNIKIIDPDVESTINSKVIGSKLDAQFLPEGGHLVASIENTMGVIIKDSLGFGVPNIEYQLRNDKNEILTNSKTDARGIGKFLFIPNSLENYHVLVKFNGNSQHFSIEKAKANGITMTLKDLNNKIAIRFGTNESTLSQIKNKSYTLAIHNGQYMTTSKINFNDALNIDALIPYNQLSSGVNVFTLFDEDRKPLLERLFFNHEGIEPLSTGDLKRIKEGDSLLITIPFKAINQNYANSFSVSVLPEATKSYNQHQNIFSATFLAPYIKGVIEDPAYYFTNIDRQKKFELDNLLLTQGWSSYDWNTIFNVPPQINYEFETGVRFTANVNKTKSGRFLMYQLTHSHAETIEVIEPDKFFEMSGLLPLTNEKVRMGELDKFQNVSKATVYLQFTPSKIPEIQSYNKISPLKENVFYSTNTSFPLLETSWRDMEHLDEVVLNVNKTEVRIEKLKARSFDNVDIFDDLERFAYGDLAAYLNVKGFRVTQDGGTFNIINPKCPPRAVGGVKSTKEEPVIIDSSYESFPDDGSPLVYVDEAIVLDYNMLLNFDMSHVDYVTINKLGFGEGFRGSCGVIRIYTDPNISYRNKTAFPPYQEIDIPLTFSEPKKFYAPKYQSYSNQFYNDYGVVDWIPNLKIDGNGIITFKISDNQQTNVSFYIEGTADNGKFLSEVKTLRL